MNSVYWDPQGQKNNYDPILKLFVYSFIPFQFCCLLFWNSFLLWCPGWSQVHSPPASTSRGGEHHHPLPRCIVSILVLKELGICAGALFLAPWRTALSWLMGNSQTFAWRPHCWLQKSHITVGMDCLPSSPTPFFDIPHLDAFMV